MSALRIVFRNNRQTLFLTFVIAGIKTCTNGIGFWILLMGLGIQSPFLYCACLIAIAQLVALVPITVLGLGTLEAICIYGMSQINIDSHFVASALIAGRIITLFWLGSFFTFFSYDGSLPAMNSARKNNKRKKTH